MKSIPTLRKKNKQYTIYDLKVDDFTLSVTYLNPEQSTVGHLHNWDEGYYFVGGIGNIQLGTKKTKISTGQFIFVPANTFHKVINDGVMSLIFVCAFKEVK